MTSSQVAFALCALMACNSAAADWLHVALRVECDEANDTFVLRMLAAYNEAGERMIEDLRQDDVNPGTLLTYAEEAVAIGDRMDIRTVVREERKVERRCELSDGVHEVRIGPAPGNAVAEGRCGVHLSMSAETRRGDGWSAPIYFYEDCHTQEVTVEIRIEPGQMEPELVKIPRSAYLHRIMADLMLQ